MQNISVNKARYLAGIIVSLTAVSAVIIHQMEPVILYNPSASAAVGFYYVSDETSYKRDDFVAAIAPINAQTLAVERHYLSKNTPLLKTIYGIPGDEICIQNGVVSVNQKTVAQVKKYDSQGRLMPYRRGCGMLHNDAYFLLSTAIENSFDSRYFGPVGEADILGVATPLLIFSK